MILRNVIPEVAVDRTAALYHGTTQGTNRTTGYIKPWTTFPPHLLDPYL